MNFIPQRVVSLFVAGAMLATFPGWAQQAGAPVSKLAAQSGGGLKIIVLEGENAQNSIKSRSATSPVVEVRDQEDKPVVGAEVVFQLPAAGPGGVFNGWMRNQTARTNEKGQAAASGLTPNDEEGRFNIKVTASQGNKTGQVIVAQSNIRNGSGSSMSKSRKGTWILVGVLAAGAAIGGGVAATRGNGSTTAATPTNPVSITAGPITVAGPR